MRKSREGGREQVTLGLIVPGKDLVRPESLRIQNRGVWSDSHFEQMPLAAAESRLDKGQRGDQETS